MSIGILNCECAVVPPSSKVAAIPEDATARAIRLSDRTFANTELMTIAELESSHPHHIYKLERIEPVRYPVEPELPVDGTFPLECEESIHCECCS